MITMNGVTKGTVPFVTHMWGETMASAEEKLEYLTKIYQEAGGVSVSNKVALAKLCERFPEEIDRHNDLLNNQQRLKSMGVIIRGDEQGEWIYTGSIPARKTSTSSVEGNCS